MKSLAAVAFVLVGLSCAPKQHVTPRYFHARPLVTLRMHADVEFTALERTLIDQAVADLEWQTAGYLAVDLEYDLNYSDAAAVDYNLLVRQPQWSMLTARVEAYHGTHVFGFTYPFARQSYLVAERLATPEMWRHVAMHELLHSAGLEDLPSRPDDIMAASRTDKVALCLSIRDAREFCRANHCDYEQLNYCRPGE